MSASLRSTFRFFNWLLLLGLLLLPAGAFAFQTPTGGVTKTPTAAPPVQESVSAVTGGLGIENYWAFQKFPLTERLTLYVNLWNGNLVTQYQEFDIPGTGFPLSLDHTYNNQANSSNNIVGYNWIHSQRMYIVDNGDNTATLYDADGTQHLFTNGATGTYTSPKGNFDTLTRASGVSFTLTHPDSSQHVFQQNGNTNWYLTQITDRQHHQRPLDRY